MNHIEQGIYDVSIGKADIIKGVSWSGQARVTLTDKDNVHKAYGATTVNYFDVVIVYDNGWVIKGQNANLLSMDGDTLLIPQYYRYEVII